MYIGWQDVQNLGPFNALPITPFLMLLYQRGMFSQEGLRLCLVIRQNSKGLTKSFFYDILEQLGFY